VSIGTLFEPGIVPARASHEDVPPTERQERERTAWRMPPLSELPPARLTMLNKVWLMEKNGKSQDHRQHDENAS
jgi:hypothetical protein